MIGHIYQLEKALIRQTIKCFILFQTNIQSKIWRKSCGILIFYMSPENYQLSSSVWKSADSISKERETKLSWTADPQEAVQGADVIYTDVWVSMGDEKEKKERLSIFSSYQVNEILVEGANDGFIFMHDMPAHRGEEISEHMLDHPNSVVYDQAENRLHAQKAVLADLFGYL